MISTFEREIAEQSAVSLLNRHKIISLPVNPQAIAELNGIQVFAKKDWDKGVDGMLVQTGSSFAIFYATYLHNVGREHFSIAHELGHYVIPGHTDNVLNADKEHFSVDELFSNNKYELEANAFASSLLMPRFLLQDKLESLGRGVAAIIKMANLCEVSLTAAAIHYTKLCGSPLFIAVSSQGKIDYCFLSEPMKRLRCYTFPRKGGKVPSRTVTADYWTNPQQILVNKPLKGEIDVSLWLETEKPGPFNEEVISLGKTGKALTVVSY